MSEIINYFNMFSDFPPNLKQNIKSCFVCVEVRADVMGYCILNDNKVYGLGHGIKQILGYKECNEKFILIRELCDQNIEEFYQGHGYMFARNDKNQIFSWGRNYEGELGRGFKSEYIEVDLYLKPERIDFFDDKNIIYIKCDLNDFWALSSDGLLYKKDYLNPILTNNFNTIKIKSILNNCLLNSFPSLYTLTFDGMIYEFCSDKRDKWKVMCDLDKMRQLIQNNEEIIDICVAHKEEVIFQTKEGVYVYQDSKMEKSIYKTIFEYFLFEYRVTYKTLHIKSNQLFVYSFERNDENSELFIKTIYLSDNSFIQNETYFNLRQFGISKDLPQIMESNVKYYYQSIQYSSDYFALFVMNDNKVYGLGKNSWGKLGLGHNHRIFDYKYVTDLSNKCVQEFYEGFNFMFARNDKNEIFSWGMNWDGKLARGFASKMNECFKPEKIDFFDDKNIINISCSERHCLALSSDGRVYGWGDNRKGQIGCGCDQKFIYTPHKINFKERIKYIHCSTCMSFSVSFEENAYFWGQSMDRYSSIKALGPAIYIPKLIPIKNVIKLYYHSLQVFVIILNTNGYAFTFDTRNEEIAEIKSEKVFSDLYCATYLPDFHYCLLQSEDCVYNYQLVDYGNHRKLIKTDFIDIKDFYSQRFNYFNKTIEISKEGYLMTKEIQFNEREKIIVLKNENIFDAKYANIFDEIDVKGEGAFGIVYEVRKNSNQTHYSIKVMEIRGELNLKEIQIMSKLNTNFVVKYFDSWIESRVILTKIKRYLYIQMELCSQNLRQIIESMNKTFEEKFQTFYYFISCELFKELIECVNYLHSLSPPIIHRDLKPENILISEGINGRFLKLCDFGLAKVSDISVNTRKENILEYSAPEILQANTCTIKSDEKSFNTRYEQGTLAYMAPEISNSRKYSSKSDIYSLALIATEIFRFEESVKIIRNHKNIEDFLKYASKYLNTILEKNFKTLIEMITKCCLPEENRYNLRPDCKQLLEKINEFSVDKSIILKENISDFKSILEKENIFLKIFFENKLEI